MNRHGGAAPTRSVVAAAIPLFVLFLAATAVAADSSDLFPGQRPPTIGPTVPAPSYGAMFVKGWIPLTGAEVVLLGVTATLPKDWTGWSPHFVRDGVTHLGEAYTKPPVWDDDWWFHNYVGHPYGGSVYYNTVRCQGASVVQSMVFSAALSVQWEFVFEAVAERPSTQDLIITPVVGSVLGELTHRLAIHLERGGTTPLEKVIIAVTNPAHAIFRGFH